MQDQAARYAIYFVPAADSALHRCGSAILGYDCHTGADSVPPDELRPDAASWRSLTEEPRRYGFHATLKAPFHLSCERTERELADAMENFAASGRAVPAIAPVVEMLEGFAAVVPQRPDPLVN